MSDPSRGGPPPPMHPMFLGGGFPGMPYMPFMQQHMLMGGYPGPFPGGPPPGMWLPPGGPMPPLSAAPPGFGGGMMPQLPPPHPGFPHGYGYPQGLPAYPRPPAPFVLHEVEVEVEAGAGQGPRHLRELPPPAAPTLPDGSGGVAGAQASVADKRRHGCRWCSYTADRRSRVALHERVHTGAPSSLGALAAKAAGGMAGGGGVGRVGDLRMVPPPRRDGGDVVSDLPGALRLPVPPAPSPASLGQGTGSQGPGGPSPPPPPSTSFVEVGPPPPSVFVCR